MINYFLVTVDNNSEKNKNKPKRAEKAKSKNWSSADLWSIIIIYSKLEFKKKGKFYR